MEYLFLFGAIWLLVEPNTSVDSQFLPDHLGGGWRIILYGGSAILALPLAIRNYLKTAVPQFLKEFRSQTASILRRTPTRITKTKTSFKRSETAVAQDLLEKSPVLLTGEGGTGKSGIGTVLVKSAIELGYEALMIDARDFQSRPDDAALREALLCDEPICDAIGGLGKIHGFRLVIDQLDNVTTLPISRVLTNLAIQCSRKRGVEVLVISRSKEDWERTLLNPLAQAGFVAITCREISREDVDEELHRMGIVDATDELIEACRNLLNLEILSRIIEHEPATDLTTLENETSLWQSFFGVVRQKETESLGIMFSDSVWNEAVQLSRQVLQAGEQYFVVPTVSPSIRRLISWNIIESVNGNRYKFRHERMPDFIYAQDAADKKLKPGDIDNDIGLEQSRNAVLWLHAIYEKANPDQELDLLESILIDE